MSFAIFSNLLLSVLCVAVLVQSMRMIRRFNAIKSGDLGETVRSLDHATAQARQVLADLRNILATDGAASVRSLASGESLREELSVMVGIGNAVAERIMEAAANAGDRDAPAEPGKAPARPRKLPAAKAAARRRAAAQAGRPGLLGEPLSSGEAAPGSEQAPNIAPTETK